MKIMRNLLIIFVLLGLTFSVYAQKKEKKTAEVQNEKMKMSSGRITFTFDIVNHKSVEMFYPSITIFDEEGQAIFPENLTGDIDRTVRGGSNKRITWYYAKDGFSDEEAKNIAFEIEIEPVLPKGYMIRRHILLSAIYPGWGDYKIRDKKRDQSYAYFLYGVAAYGSVGAALLYNSKASKSYDDYKVSETITQSQNNYDNAKKFKTMSYIFAGAAVAIWTIDIASGIIRINKKSGSYASRENSKIFIGYDYSPQLDQPMVSLKIKL
jgi:hypothetical protein